MEKHQKHAKMTKPNLGNFGRNEWAIIGTPCGNIQKLALELSEELTPQYKTAYIDADHKAGDEGANLSFDTVYTDKIGYHRFDFKGQLTPFQFRPFFNETDIVLVNGNHFSAKRQLIVLDPKKMESLSRKLDRLTQVDAFLSLDNEHKLIPDFLKSHLPHWADIPVFNIQETNKIAEFLTLNVSKTPIKGLILAGGKSTRMGADKAFLDYHGQPQFAFLADILRGLDIEPHISCRAEQKTEFSQNYETITDTFLDLGPYGALLSAFRQDPNAAWLAVACDLPLLDESTLEFLIENRNEHKIATSFRSPESKEGFPEPLIAIWEPSAYPVLLQFLAQGINCPRKVLINSDIELLTPSVSDALTNVNTPEERDSVLNLLTQ
ncbi:MAG: NTP transferase domain-containing protein [Saprospiraceae bacterium]|nr:NTP transferase domain-containing protein [Saprospiraceae bacterium]